MSCSKWSLLAAWLAVGLVLGGCDLMGPGSSRGREVPSLDDVLNDRLPLADSPDRIFCDLSHFGVNVRSRFMPAPSIETETGCGLRMTESAEMQAMSAYLGKPLALANDGSFHTRFSFRIHGVGGTEDDDGPGADGFVFVLQSVSDGVIGAGGGFLAYGGIWSSVGVEFDTYSNHGQHSGDGEINDPNGNHVGINLDGSLESLVTASVPKRLNDGEVWWVWIDYDGQTNELSVRLAESQERPEEALLSAEVDVRAVLGGTAAWVGFTAATGGGYQAHDILTWQFESGGQSIAGEHDKGHTVTLFMAGDAVQLVRQGTLDQLKGLGTGDLRTLFDALVASGASFYLSGGSSQARGLTETDLGGLSVTFGSPGDLVRQAVEHDRMFTY